MLLKSIYFLCKTRFAQKNMPFVSENNKNYKHETLFIRYYIQSYHMKLTCLSKQLRFIQKQLQVVSFLTIILSLINHNENLFFIVTIHFLRRFSVLHTK
jgi:hypothetical protein